jgi:uncharacterized protein YjeT (DUF2065 family)
MNPILFVIAILWIAVGTSLIIYTGWTRRLWSKILERDNFKWLAILPGIFGLILIASAFYYAKAFWVALILGILALLKGLYLIIGPSHQLKALFDWWIHKAGDGTMRLYGMITFILGSVLLAYIY